MRRSSEGPLWANGKLRLVLTSQCNVACFYCHNEGQPKGLEFLGPDLFNQIVHTAEEAGEFPRAVTFTGGEPLLNPHVHDYASRLKGLVKNLSIVTNGLLLDEKRIDRLLLAGITSVRIGIDSLAGKSRPTRGAADVPTVLSAIEMLIERGIKPKLNVVLTHFNTEQIGPIVMFCIRRGLSAKFFAQVHSRSSIVGGIQFEPARRDFLPFELFDQLVKAVCPGIVASDCPDLGDANCVYVVNGVELRYCRFLCSFAKCHVTGTRVDPLGKVYTCMNASEGLVINSGEPIADSIDSLRRAVSLGCPSRLVAAGIPRLIWQSQSALST